MTVDLLERLRAADPVVDVDPAPPDELLRALLATPVRRRRRHRALIPVAAAAAAVVALFFIRDGAPASLAERAYAKTAPAPHAILYVRTTIRSRMRAPGHDQDSVETSEQWQQGARWHAVTRGDDGRTREEVRGADGVLRFSDGETARAGDGGDAAEYIARRAHGFLASFRDAYARGRLDERGDAVFAGRAARRYVVSWPAGTGDARNFAEYFLDAKTGLPLGSRERAILLGPGADGRPSKRIGTNTTVTTVDALKQLPETPENRAKLEGTSR